MKKDKPDRQDRQDKHENEDHQREGSNASSGGENAGKEEQHMVALTFEEFDAMEKTIESLKAETEEHKDQWLRSVADFDNYKKRVLRDTTRNQQDAMTSVLKIFLQVADDIERALTHKPSNPEVEGWVSGIELIYQKLLNLMKNQGVERMEVKPGDTFDPNIHEAITQEEHPDFEDGQIIDVVQPGYRISERIIRPAMVRVAR
jgi:molecular chaperone GrpE